MSQENVDLVMRLDRAFNERDIATLEAITSDDVVLRLIGGFADLMGTEFRGRDAALSWVREWISTLDGHFEIETIHAVEDQVVSIDVVRATGSASGAPAVMRVGMVYSFRDGLISALDSYFVAADALKAVGLPEQDAQADS